MDKKKKRDYLVRLLTPDKSGDCFVFQFLEGDGNELQKKFWAPNSSSRMAFELYSGLRGMAGINDLRFEFQLPGLKSGGKGPNMDVLIETAHDLIFIESKFSEKANLHYIDNNYLSKAYYYDGLHGKKTLKERFHKNEWATDFAGFCKEWEEEMVLNGWHDGCDWFEPKQETCHLSGILLFLFKEKNAERIKGKRIRLFNVYWRFDGQDGNPSMSQRFEEKANTLIEKIISQYGSNLGFVDFEIGCYTVQDIRKNPELLSPDIHNLGINVEERLKEFDNLANGQTRRKFRVK
jgi:hypothetical protein